MAPPLVFLCTVTGGQGRPLALELRRRGWAVRGVSRTPDSSAATQVKAAGVEVLAGDWDDVDSLTDAMAGAQFAFLHTITYADDPDRERRQGLNMVAAARAAGVRHVVLSGSLGVVKIGDASLSPFSRSVFVGKREIELAVERAGFDSWTIIRPAFFMNNILTPQVDYFLPHLRQENVWSTVMRPGQRVALADSADIGKLVAVIFEDPSKYHGRAIPFASELLTVPEMLRDLERATGGVSFEQREMTEEEIDAHVMSFSFMMADRVMREQANYMDMDELAAAVSLTTFAQWLDKEKEAVMETYG